MESLGEIFHLASYFNPLSSRQTLPKNHLQRFIQFNSLFQKEICTSHDESNCINDTLVRNSIKHVH